MRPHRRCQYLVSKSLIRRGHLRSHKTNGCNYPHALDLLIVRACGRPLSGRGVSKYCKDHAQLGYLTCGPDRNREYVQTFRRRQLVRHILHPFLNEIIDTIRDHFRQIGKLESCLYIDSNRQEIFKYLRKSTGDLSIESHYYSSPVHVGGFGGRIDYLVHYFGTFNLRPLDEVPPFEIASWDGDCRAVYAGRMWVGTYVPQLCIFTKKALAEEVTQWKPEIDIWIHHLAHQVSEHFDSLEDGRELTVIVLPIPGAPLTLVSTSGIEWILEVGQAEKSVKIESSVGFA
jgi:hypothetical protein